MERFLVFIVGFALFVVILRYRVAIRDFTGDIGFAERYLGSGGTNTLIVLIAILVLVLGLMYALGTLDTLLQNTLGMFFGN